MNWLPWARHSSQLRGTHTCDGATALPTNVAVAPGARSLAVNATPFMGPMPNWIITRVALLAESPVDSVFQPLFRTVNWNRHSILGTTAGHTMTTTRHADLDELCGARLHLSAHGV